MRVLRLIFFAVVPFLCAAMIGCSVNHDAASLGGVETISPATRPEVPTASELPKDTEGVLVDNSVSEDSPAEPFAPEEADYFNKVFTEKIADDMPLFDFNLYGFIDTDTTYFPVRLESLTITQISDGSPIQEITIPDKTMFGKTNGSDYDDAYGFVLEDVNFDGYKDIRIFDTMNGTYRDEYIYLVWNPSKHIFENDRRLNKIPCAEFDQGKRLIYGMERGSAADHSYYTYRYIDGDIVFTQLTTNNAVIFLDSVTDEQLAEVVPEIPDGTQAACQFTRENSFNFNTMEWEITEERFDVYESSPVDWKLLAPYDASSPIGEKLKALVDWRRMGIDAYLDWATSEEFADFLPSVTR